MTRHHFKAAAHAAKAGEDPQDPYSVAFEHGSLELGFYSPGGRDLQEPHDQDEVYVVLAGRGRFVNGEQVTDFEPGDALFVPAGVEHRFVDFTDDTEMWVIFYGPRGGEGG